MFISQAYQCYQVQRENNSSSETVNSQMSNERAKLFKKIKQTFNYKRRMFQSM